MVFLYLNKVSRPTFGGEIQLKGHGFSLAPRGQDGFLLFQILKILEKGQWEQTTIIFIG